jgi:hypothetical protein
MTEEENQYKRVQAVRRYLNGREPRIDLCIIWLFKIVAL